MLYHHVSARTMPTCVISPILRSKQSIAIALLLFFTVDLAQARFTVLHNFDRTADGEDPISTVVVRDEAVFGTTQFGGANGEGIVWSFNTDSGTFTKLHDFGGSDGIRPVGGLAVDGNVLLGTAQGGNTYNGTIWSVDTTTGAFAKLHDFASFTDGSGPQGSLAVQNHSIYGITRSDGGFDVGSIWQFDTIAGTFTKLHAFHLFSQGAIPTGGVTIDAAALYGTARGGTNGHGVIWQFDITSSTYTKLHDFLSSTDGRSPEGSVIVNGNMIYGTAERGGADDRGTIWSLDITTGQFTNLHSFSGTSDGLHPQGSIAFDGTTLFGTSLTTIWSLETTSGQFRTQHQFNRATDGDSPIGGLILNGSTLYGTNVVGGASPFGDGTLWKFVIPEPASAALFSRSCSASRYFAVIGNRLNANCASSGSKKYIDHYRPKRS
jgi:uncharacterized repeat protein (TIGR03803 family)